MKWVTLCSAIGLALLSNNTAEAGFFSDHFGAAKSCDSTPDCQPACCKPVICRPVCRTRCNYQRSCCKPVCCAQTAPSCCAPASCCAPGACGGTCGVCCEDNRYLVAHYIHKSQTACYAKQRSRAIDKLGDKFLCSCNPEIMSAFIYALNDSDERVRGEAADEIGDQLRKSRCCCSPELICALTQALGDCDRRVRREAEEALRIAGYDVKDCNVCSTSCAPSCCAPATQSAPPAAAPAPESDSTPPPAPAATDNTAHRRSGRGLGRLAGLFHRKR